MATMNVILNVIYKNTYGNGRWSIPSNGVGSYLAFRDAILIIRQYFFSEECFKNCSKYWRQVKRIKWLIRIIMVITIPIMITIMILYLVYRMDTINL